MSTWSIIFFALLLIGAAAAAWAPGEHAPEPSPFSPLERIAIHIFHFFGIGGVPLGLAVAVLLSTAAIAGLTLDIIARLHLGETYPAWFLIDATASGLGVGLLSTRMLAASYETESLPDHSRASQ